MSNIDLNFLKISQNEWKQLVQAELKGKNFNKNLKCISYNPKLIQENKALRES